MCAWHSPRRLLLVPSDAAVQGGSFRHGASVALGGGATRAADVKLQDPLSQRAQYATASGQVVLQDRRPAPAVQSAVFDSSGARLVVTFASDVDASIGTGRQQAGSCDSLFSNVAGVLAARAQGV